MLAALFVLLLATAHGVQNRYGLKRNHVQFVARDQYGEKLLDDMRAFDIVHLTQRANTTAGKSLHPESLELQFATETQTFDLLLQKNDILGARYRSIQMNENEEIVSVSERNPALDCHYHGRVKGVNGGPDGKVFVSTCDGLSGEIHAHGQHLHIMPLGRYFSTFQHKTLSMQVSPTARLEGSHLLVNHMDVQSAQRNGCAAIDAEHTPVFVASEADIAADLRFAPASAFPSSSSSSSSSHGAHAHVHPHSHTHSDEEQLSSSSAFGTQDISSSSRQHQQQTLACSGSVTFLEVVIINDVSQYQRWGADTEAHTASIANIADGYYQNTQFTQFCVRIRLVGQVTYTTANIPTVTYRTCNTLDTTQTQCNSCTGCYSSTTQSCPCSSPDSTSSYEVDSTQLLKTFTSSVLSGTRYTRLISLFGSIDQISLFTQRDFGGDAVGLAWTSTMCRRQNNEVGSSAIIQEFSTVVGYTGQVYAHEMGHNWGMSHDPASPRYIMSFSSGPSGYGTTFSSSSISNLANWYTSIYQQTGYPKCLAGTPVGEYASPFCGNGIIEAGEQCDPGAETDTCCSSTCQLNVGCLCANSQPCCSLGTFRPSSYQCRARAHSVCDTPEFCTGSSATCPNDVYSPPSTSCTDADNFASNCFKGTCAVSRSSSCNRLQSGNTGCDSSTSCTTLACSISGPCSSAYTSLFSNNGNPCGGSSSTSTQRGNVCLDGVCVSAASIAPTPTGTPAPVAPVPTSAPVPTFPPTRPPTRSPTMPTTASPTTQSADSAFFDNISTAAIVGIAVGAVVLLAILLAFICCCCCCARAAQPDPPSHVPQPYPAHLQMYTPQPVVAYAGQPQVYAHSASYAMPMQPQPNLPPKPSAYARGEGEPYRVVSV